MLEPFHITREDLMVAQRDALMDHDRRVTEPMAEIATPRIAIVRRPERVCHHVTTGVASFIQDSAKVVRRWRGLAECEGRCTLDDLPAFAMLRWTVWRTGVGLATGRVSDRQRSNFRRDRWLRPSLELGQPSPLSDEARRGSRY